MINLLIAFPYKIKNTEEWEKILNGFDIKNYYVYELEGMGSNEFDLGNLLGIIEHYTNLHEHVNKIVVLSSARDLIFSWYRCYNSLVDDFVYFVDEIDSNLFLPANELFSFYYNLYEFNGINKENVEGKIYINKKDDKILPIYYEENYFDELKNFDYLDKKKKQFSNRKYIFNKFEYNFTINDEYFWHRVKMDGLNKKIAFLKGQSQYDVLRIATDYCANFYMKLGFKVDLIDLLDTNIDNLVMMLMNNEYDFVYATNCMAIDIELKDGRNLFDLLDIPFLGTLGDHPVNQLSRIIKSPQKTLFACLDKENIKYLKKHFPQKKIVANFSNAFQAVNYKNKKFDDRSIDILFAGSLTEPAEIKKSWINFDKQTQLIIYELTELTVDMKYLINIDREITKVLKKHKVKNPTLKYKAFIHSQIERYIRDFKRYRLVEKLGESDIKIFCIGNVDSFSKLNKSGNLILNDKVDYAMLLEMMNDSKMVLNLTGHLYDGITERVLSSMINGAVAVTEEDRFTCENFIDEENILLYNFDTVVNKISVNLESIDKLEMIARNGQKEAIAKYDYRIGLSKIPRLIDYYFK